MLAMPLYFLLMGIAWSFALFMWFGGSLKQRHCTSEKAKTWETTEA